VAGRLDVVVGPDGRTAAVTQVTGSGLSGGPIAARVEVVDVALGRILWDQQSRERTAREGARTHRTRRRCHHAGLRAGTTAPAAVTLPPAGVIG